MLGTCFVLHLKTVQKRVKKLNSFGILVLRPKNLSWTEIVLVPKFLSNRSTRSAVSRHRNIFSLSNNQIMSMRIQSIYCKHMISLSRVYTNILILVFSKAGCVWQRYLAWRRKLIPHFWSDGCSTLLLIYLH